MVEQYCRKRRKSFLWVCGKSRIYNIQIRAVNGVAEPHVSDPRREMRSPNRLTSQDALHKVCLHRPAQPCLCRNRHKPFGTVCIRSPEFSPRHIKAESAAAAVDSHFVTRGSSLHAAKMP